MPVVYFCAEREKAMLTPVKSTVYLDATIPSFMFDERESLTFPCEMTRRWWREESSRYDVFISRETIAELSRGNYPAKEEVRRFVASLRSLEPNPSIAAVASEYVRHMVMPADASGDAAHLAYASYYGIDFLLTWNCSHLANARKRRHIETINLRLGLSTPAIITPLELFGGM
jgi:predicted nucleic acid-binding protein